ncbi:hypothetical protein GF322_03765 [Candidatus Dependentiae bacterium]|nr:hypothetical protein [Candidatus Dependentiae bacterium]
MKRFFLGRRYLNIIIFFLIFFSFNLKSNNKVGDLESSNKTAEAWMGEDENVDYCLKKIFDSFLLKSRELGQNIRFKIINCQRHCDFDFENANIKKKLFIGIGSFLVIVIVLSGGGIFIKYVCI